MAEAGLVGRRAVMVMVVVGVMGVRVRLRGWGEGRRRTGGQGREGREAGGGDDGVRGEGRVVGRLVESGTFSLGGVAVGSSVVVPLHATGHLGVQVAAMHLVLL